MAFTPSSKVREQIAAQPVEDNTHSESRIVLLMKTLFGSPVPILQSLYVIALLSSMAGMEIFIWSVSLFTFIYILVDIFGRDHEFRFFRLGVEIPIIGLLTVVIMGFYINAPDADKVFGIGHMRWMITLYLMTFSFDLFPGLNKFVYLLMGLSPVVACYAIWQHFTGIDLVRGASSIAVTKAPYAGSTVYQNVAFFSHHLSYGYSFAMLMCFPVAALLLSRNRHPFFRILMLASIALIGVTLYWTYGRGVWIATAASLALMTFYVSKKYFFTAVAIVLIIVGSLYKFDTGFRERFSSMWAENYRSNTDRKDLWAANIEMFKDYPWLGVGYRINEDRTQEYYKKMGITNDFSGHAHNNYIQMLSSTGFLGLTFFMIFIVSYLLITHRLWTDVPKTHFWHRVVALGALGAQVVFHTGGLTQFTFGTAVNLHLYMYVLAVVGYMAHKYSVGVVPDDYSL